jgi:hypothetical protein
MGIEINEKLIGIWYVSFGTDDWMGALYERDDGQIDLIFRCRYYRSPDAWDGKDKKSWFKNTSPKSVEEAIGHLRTAVNKLCAIRKPCMRHELLRGNDTPMQFLARFSALPFVHERSGIQSETLTDLDLANQYLLRRKRTGAPLLHQGEPLKIVAESDAAARRTARETLIRLKLPIPRIELSLVRIEESGQEITVPWSGDAHAR